MKSTIPSLLLGLLLVGTACSQRKAQCNDPFALNYNEDASTNIDCDFPDQQRTPLLAGYLNGAIPESSGLAFVNDMLITHNDKGNENELFVINVSGSLLQTFTVVGAENADWEDLANSSSHLFIGDFGNSDGNRTDLRIYTVALENLANSTNNEVPVEGTIRFSYPEQVVAATPEQHNFDCEAMVYKDGFLYLFMKHRADNMSALYRLPADTGSHQAVLLGSFRATARITGAAISPDGAKVVLVGYNKNGDCILWELTDFGTSHPLAGAKKRTILGPYASIGQIEAVCFWEGRYFMTSEYTAAVPATVSLLSE